MRGLLVWLFVAVALGVPLVLAAFSPLLQWRQPVYIAAGFAGVGAMGLLLLQPLLNLRALPGLSARQSQVLHRSVGAALVLAILAHVVGLWITSPPDVLDALLFRSPTPFSVWGVVAMWAVFLTALVAVLRRQMKLRPGLWRRLHKALALVIVTGGIVHALLIEGTMELISKVLLCAVVAIATLWVVFKPSR